MLIASAGHRESVTTARPCVTTLSAFDGKSTGDGSELELQPAARMTRATMPTVKRSPVARRDEVCIGVGVVDESILHNLRAAGDRHQEFVTGTTGLTNPAPVSIFRGPTTETPCTALSPGPSPSPWRSPDSRTLKLPN